MKTLSQSLTVTAAVLREPDAPFEVERVELAVPDRDEILVEIAGVGMCHTDLLPRNPQFNELYRVLPAVLGHEGSGVVTAVGSDVSEVVPGDRVVLTFDHCQRCRQCRGGRPAYCSTMVERNMTGRNPDRAPAITDQTGATLNSRWFGQSSFATHCLVTARNVVTVDADLPLELLGPLGCSMQTGAGTVFNVLPVSRGTTIAIFGAGSVGLASIMAARIAGATTIVAIDTNHERLEMATELGATHAVDPVMSRAARTIGSLTGGGVDHSIDTTGSPTIINEAVRALTPIGTCALVGAQTSPLSLGPTDIAYGRTLTGVIEGDACPRELIPQLVDLWRAGQFPFDRLTRRFALADIADAERASCAGDVIKPVLIP